MVKIYTNDLKIRKFNEFERNKLCKSSINFTSLTLTLQNDLCAKILIDLERIRLRHALESAM